MIEGGVTSVTTVSFIVMAGLTLPSIGGADSESVTRMAPSRAAMRKRVELYTFTLSPASRVMPHISIDTLPPMCRLRFRPASHRGVSALFWHYGHCRRRTAIDPVPQLVCGKPYRLAAGGRLGSITLAPRGPAKRPADLEPRPAFSGWKGHTPIIALSEFALDRPFLLAAHSPQCP